MLLLNRQAYPKIQSVLSNSSCIKTIQFPMSVSSPRSFYEILQVPKNATPKQIRVQFLKKARTLHPDHNPSPQAHEQFKKLKQAYQNLKDPQKRYLYDTGVNSDEINENGYSGPMEQGEPGKKYYQNKWYNFKKNATDQRDDYYESKFAHYADNKQTILYRISAIAVLGIGYFAYDFLMRRQSQGDRQRKQVKNILEGSAEDKRSKKMRRYMDERLKVNKVE